MKVRDRRRRGWMWVQNEIVDNMVQVIGPMGVTLYLILSRYADQHETAYPSYATIATRMGVSRRTVIRAMKVLVAAKLVEVEQRQRKNGANTSNIYYLIDPPVTNSHRPGDTGDTSRPERTLIEMNKTHTNGVSKSTSKTQDDPADKLVRHAYRLLIGECPQPSRSDLDHAAALLETHGDRAEAIITEAAKLAKHPRKGWPDCRTLGGLLRFIPDAAKNLGKATRTQAKATETTRRLRDEAEDHQAEYEAQDRLWSFLRPDERQAVLDDLGPKYDRLPALRQRMAAALLARRSVTHYAVLTAHGRGGWEDDEERERWEHYLATLN